MVELNQHRRFKGAYFTAIILVFSALISEHIREYIVNEVSRTGVSGGWILVGYGLQIALLALLLAIPIMMLMDFLKI